MSCLLGTILKKPLLSCNKGLNEEAKVVLHNKRNYFLKKCKYYDGDSSSLITLRRLHGA